MISKKSNERSTLRKRNMSIETVDSTVVNNSSAIISPVACKMPRWITCSHNRDEALTPITCETVISQQTQCIKMQIIGSKIYKHDHFSNKSTDVFTFEENSDILCSCTTDLPDLLLLL